MKGPNPPRSKPCEDDGGPAYPCLEQSPSLQNKPNEGLSKRDAFAIAALTGVCSNPTNTETVRGLGHFPTFAAEWAYRMADAMLDVRAKGRTE